MRYVATGISTAVFLTVVAVGATSGQAQLLNTLKDAAGGAGTGSGAMSSLALPSVGSASSSNIAGVLKFCVQNQLAGGADASSVQSSLVNKLGGAKNEQAAPAYQSGSKGVLEASGKSVDVSQLNTQIKSTVCDQVLQRAKSLL